MSVWPAGPRFVVHEFFGALNVGNGGFSQPGYSTWVADDAFHGKTIGLWRTEDYRGGMSFSKRLARSRDQARRLADRLNAEEAEA
jgi:hypothetical protein